MSDLEKTQPLQQEYPPELEEDLLVNVTGGASSRSSRHSWSRSSDSPVPSNSDSSRSGQRTGSSDSSATLNSDSSHGSSTFSDANSDFLTFVHSREPTDLNVPNWVPGATPAKRRRIL